ncbi:hypothetical protein JCM9534A_69470 [Catenuloplanes indicus JCM 9534]
MTGAGLYAWAVIEGRAWESAAGLLLACGALAAHALLGASDLELYSRLLLAAGPACAAVDRVAASVVRRHDYSSGSGIVHSVDEQVLSVGLLTVLAAVGIVGAVATMPGVRRRRVWVPLAAAGAGAVAAAWTVRVVPGVFGLDAVPGPVPLLVAVVGAAGVLTVAGRRGLRPARDAVVLAAGAVLLAGPDVAHAVVLHRGEGYGVFYNALPEPGPLRLVPAGDAPDSLLHLAGLVLIVVAVLGVRGRRTPYP